MSATSPDVLARLRLVEGQSGAELREFARSPGTKHFLTVGASDECDWCVRDDGVAQVHFSLHWDGKTLGIADTHRAGNVRIDGELIGAEWRRLSGRARIEFGRAAIVVETSASTVHSEPENGRPWFTMHTQPPRTVPRTTLSHDQRTGQGNPPVHVINDASQAQVLGHGSALNRLSIAEDDRRIPNGVLVLSPIGGSTTATIERCRISSEPAPPGAHWSMVLLTLLALASCYGSWLYLLYHL